MSWQHIALRACPAQAWRNGGGLTHELATWPAADDWRWRVSVARIDRDGPFSAFDQVQRWFAVLTGDGVTLSWPNEQRVLTPQSEPMGFAGAPACEARLIGGPTTDFNLMTRQMQGALTRQHDTHTQATWPANAHVGVFACSDCQWSADGVSFDQDAHSLRWTFTTAPVAWTWRRGDALVFVLHAEERP